MNELKVILILLLFFINYHSYGQINDFKTGKITGKIIDENTNYPIEYANILLYNKKDSSLVTGTITNTKGKFILDTVAFGKYFIECRFIGYWKSEIDNITINSNNFNINLKTILIKPAIENLNEVSVKAEKPRMEFKIDKEIINVDKDLSSAGGTAVDVLKNSPSIQTDLKGNVSLRGSQSFTLLIDGKPTVMDPSKELKFIQASTIDKIEIITNPSAKYNPDGVAGIINIITKKNNQENGFNGTINTSIGSYKKYQFNAQLNFKTKKIRIISDIGSYNLHYYETDYDNRTLYLNDTISIKTIYNDDLQVYKTWGKLGADYFANKNTTLGFSIEYYKRGQNDENISNASHSSNYYYTNNYNGTYSGNYYIGNFSFDHKFHKKWEKITANTNFVFLNYWVINNLIIDTTNSDFETMGLHPYKTKENENMDYFRNKTKIDYTKPIGKNGLLETGYNYQFVENHSLNNYKSFNFDLNSWVNTYADTNNFFIHSKLIHSIYGIYSNNLKKLKFKIGLRLEYYTRLTDQKSINEKFILKQWNYFPSFHLQYKISKKQTLQTSYSRRIHRFSSIQLNPLPISLDANNISKGNPELQPEFIDSYELNHLFYFKSSYLSTKLYYRQTNDLVEKYQILQNDGILLHTYKNLNKSFTTGAELTLNLKINKWWLINTNINFFQYQLMGTIDNDVVNKFTKSYDLKFENTFTLKYSVKIQITGKYKGPTISSQENFNEFYTVGLAIKKDFFNRKLNFALRIDDVFNTGIYFSTIQSSNYFIYSESRLRYPVLYLQITYKL